MTSARVLQPRHEKVAARANTVLYLVPAALLLVFLLVHPAPLPADLLLPGCTLFLALVALGLVTCVVPGRWLTQLGLWPVLSVAGVLAVSGFTVMFPAQAHRAQLLMAFPVLFAAWQMRAPMSAAVTTLAVAANAVTLLRIERPTEVFFDLLAVAPGLVVITVLLVQAMNQLEQLIGALRQQAAVDSLTGLVTRRVFDEALQHTLSAAPRPEGTALILVDVDEFKSINDTHGHPVGDEALVHLAGVLTGQVRSGDAVVSRLGGDELAVLLPGCSAEAAARRAEQLVETVRTTPLLLPDGTRLALSISVGVAHAPRHAGGLHSLYAAADAALYRAKNAGRNRAVVAAA